MIASSLNHKRVCELMRVFLLPMQTKREISWGSTVRFGPSVIRRCGQGVKASGKLSKNLQQKLKSCSSVLQLCSRSVLELLTNVSSIQIVYKHKSKQRSHFQITQLCISSRDDKIHFCSSPQHSTPLLPQHFATLDPERELFYIRKERYKAIKLVMI
jgi:hypothetical protein